MDDKTYFYEFCIQNLRYLLKGKEYGYKITCSLYDGVLIMLFNNVPEIITLNCGRAVIDIKNFELEYIKCDNDDTRNEYIKMAIFNVLEYLKKFYIPKLEEWGHIISKKMNICMSVDDSVIEKEYAGFEEYPLDSFSDNFDLNFLNEPISNDISAIFQELTDQKFVTYLALLLQSFDLNYLKITSQYTQSYNGFYITCRCDNNFRLDIVFDKADSEYEAQIHLTNIFIPHQYQKKGFGTRIINGLLTFCLAEDDFTTLWIDHIVNLSWENALEKKGAIFKSYDKYTGILLLVNSYL